MKYVFRKSGAIVTVVNDVHKIAGRKKYLYGHVVRRVDTGKEFFALKGSLTVFVPDDEDENFTAVDTLTQPIPAPQELYRHYKGGEYVILNVATHTETQETMVVYLSLRHGSVWCRPLKVWNQFVTNEKSLIPRFIKIKPVAK